MITLFGKALYWPGERVLRTRLEASDLLIERLRDERSALATQLQQEVGRLTDALLKARGIYAGPMAGYQTADGTGFVLKDEQVIGQRVTREQESRHGLRGMLRLNAEVELSGVDVYAIVEASHVEWEGVKWKAGPPRLDRQWDSPWDGRTVATVPLEAFVECARPGRSA